MARYILRNKEKIVNYYDEKFYNRLILSLEEAFKEGKELDIENIDGEPYPILTVFDEGHSYGFIFFYVIKKTFDVHLLAFKEVVN